MFSKSPRFNCYPKREEKSLSCTRCKKKHVICMSEEHFSMMKTSKKVQIQKTEEVHQKLDQSILSPTPPPKKILEDNSSMFSGIWNILNEKTFSMRYNEAEPEQNSSPLPESIVEIHPTPAYSDSKIYDTISTRDSSSVEPLLQSLKTELIQYLQQIEVQVDSQSKKIEDLRQSLYSSDEGIDLSRNSLPQSNNIRDTIHTAEGREILKCCKLLIREAAKEAVTKKKTKWSKAKKSLRKFFGLLRRKSD